MLDRSIKTVDQAEATLGLPVFAAVPETTDEGAVPRLKRRSRRFGSSNYRVVVEIPESPAAEAFRNLRAALSLLGPEVERKVSLFTSALPNEGKSFTSANYSLALAQQGYRVLLIDGDLRRPNMHRIFRFPEAMEKNNFDAHGAPGARLAATGLPLTPTLEQILTGLSPPDTKGPGMPPGHFYRPLVGVDLERAKALKPGQTMRDLPAELWHDSYHRRAYRRVMDGTPSERRGGAPAGVKRLRADRPSKAITSGAISEFIHPHEDRNLTLRECAKIQTFSDDFTFHGACAEQAQLIGNAVPPLLAWAVAASVMSLLGHSAQTPQWGR